MTSSRADPDTFVLVVEDDPDLNRSVCASLASTHRVATAFDGEEGLAKALELRPDIVLTDLEMPKMRGDELIRAIRARRELDETAIVLVTAKADEELRARIFSEGAQDHILKPFVISELRVRLANVIASRRVGRAKERLASLVEQAPDGIFIADLEGRYTEVNGAACRLLGYSREELVGKSIVDLVRPDELARLRREKETLIAGAVHVSEWELRRKDGSFVPVEVSAKILADGRWQAFVRDISERRRIREERREARERFELALRGADLATWDWNVATGEVVFNARWAEMRGFQLDEIERRVDTWMAGVHPDDWARVEKTLNDHFEGRSPIYEAEHRAKTKGGEWIWILDRGKVFARDERGRPTRMAGTELDITERKRLEEELRTSEAKLSGIVTMSLDAIVSVDDERRITLFNKGAEMIFGWTAEEALGRPLSMLIPERLRSIHESHVEAFAASPEAARPMSRRAAALFGRRKNGDEFPAEAAISRLDVNGKTILTATVRDITERERAAREQRFLADAGTALASSLDYEETLANIARLTVEHLADACIVDIVEEDGEIRRLGVFGRDPSKAGVRDFLARVELDRRRPYLTRSAIERQRPALVSRVSPELLASFAQSEAHARALRGLDVRSLLSVPLLARGRLVGVLGLISSTPARIYGPADVRFAEELGGRAALSIENARLYRAARRAIAARDDVLGIVAHDLRNPLGAVLLHAGLILRMGERASAVARPAAAIEQAARRMNRLIEDLLDVTRVEAGRLSLERVGVSPRRILSECAEAQKPQAAAASLDLLLDAPEDLPEVWADHDRLLQVFENLIGNAMKFTDAGGRITVGAARGTGEVVFSVADTGAGMAAEALPHVFDRFWQAEATKKRGAGLGLAIVKGIVEAHGGRVWVESAPGRGTTFRFTIPQAARARAAA